MAKAKKQTPKKKAANKPTTAPQKFERTISQELHEEWKSMRRTNDIKEMHKVIGKSPPTLIRALTYGCVKKQKLIDDINKFFSDRIKKEKEQAEKFRNNNK